MALLDTSGVGGFPGGGWGMGAAGLGFGADLYAFLENQKRQAAIQKIYDMLTNPGKLQAYAGQFMPQYSPAAIALMNQGTNANYASTTGGAPGGAAQQFTADAWAKQTSNDWFNALNSARGALGGALGAAGQNPGGGPLGNLGQMMNILAKIKGAQQPQTTPGLSLTALGDTTENAIPPGSILPNQKLDMSGLG